MQTKGNRTSSVPSSGKLFGFCVGVLGVCANTSERTTENTIKGIRPKIARTYTLLYSACVIPIVATLQINRLQTIGL